jgi:predicted protein tyrosine phosphatase
LTIPDDAIVIADRSAAGRILCSPRRCSEFAYLVSIGAPQERQPAGLQNVRHRLRLVFEDTVTEEEGGASASDIERLIRFGRRVDLSTGKVLVHCQAGISRSAAAAIVIVATILGPGQEVGAVEHVRRTHPHTRPNRRMLEIADTLLQAAGRLTGAMSLGSSRASDEGRHDR